MNRFGRMRESEKSRRLMISIIAGSKRSAGRRRFAVCRKGAHATSARSRTDATLGERFFLSSPMNDNEANAGQERAHEKGATKVGCSDVAARSSHLGQVVDGLRTIKRMDDGPLRQLASDGRRSGERRSRRAGCQRSRARRLALLHQSAAALLALLQLEGHVVGRRVAQDGERVLVDDVPERDGHAEDLVACYVQLSVK